MVRAELCLFCLDGWLPHLTEHKIYLNYWDEGVEG